MPMIAKLILLFFVDWARWYIYIFMYIYIPSPDENIRSIYFLFGLEHVGRADFRAMLPYVFSSFLFRR